MLTQNTLQKHMVKHLRKARENTPKLSVTDDENKAYTKDRGCGWAVIILVNSTTKLFHFLEFSILK